MRAPVPPAAPGMGFILHVTAGLRPAANTEATLRALKCRRCDFRITESERRDARHKIVFPGVGRELPESPARRAKLL